MASKSADLQLSVVRRTYDCDITIDEASWRLPTPGITSHDHELTYFSSHQDAEVKENAMTLRLLCCSLDPDDEVVITEHNCIYCRLLMLNPDLKFQELQDIRNEVNGAGSRLRELSCSFDLSETTKVEAKMIALYALWSSSSNVKPAK